MQGLETPWPGAPSAVVFALTCGEGCLIWPQNYGGEIGRNEGAASCRGRAPLCAHGLGPHL